MRSEILAIHLGALGDVILFGRLLERLGGRVTLVAGDGKARLLEGLGVVSRAIDFDALPMHELFADEPAERYRLPALLGECDRLVSCFAGGSTAAELRLVEMCRARDAAFLPVRLPDGYAGHLLDLWAERLSLPAGVFANPRPWPVPDGWSEDAAKALREAGVRPGEPYAVLHPGAGSADKCWPLERFLELAKLLRTEDMACEQAMAPQALFVLGPVEQERWRVAAIDEIRREFSTLVAPPLSTLAGVLAGAAGYAGNDSGASHLAAAVGTPTVAIFGPTQAQQFAPVGPHTRVVAGARLQDIGPADVLGALSAIWRR